MKQKKSMEIEPSMAGFADRFNVFGKYLLNIIIFTIKIMIIKFIEDKIVYKQVLIYIFFLKATVL